MANASRRKGTSWESLCVDALRDHGVKHAERRTLNGSHDRGDLAGMPGVVWECKAEKSYDLPGYLREAERERVNDGADIGIVWMKAPGKGRALDGYIVMKPRDVLYLLRAAGYIGGQAT